MLETISLENFKSFKNLHELKIKPVTILAGTNSCGKTSILQSILLFRQSFESQDPNQNILLNGRFVHLGTFANLIYGKDENESISFTFNFRIGKDVQRLWTKGTTRYPLFLLIQYIIPEKYWHRNKEFTIRFKISFNITKGKRIDTFIKPININKLYLEILDISNNKVLTSLDITEAEKNTKKYKVNLTKTELMMDFQKRKKLNKKNINEILELEFNKFIPYIKSNDNTDEDTRIFFHSMISQTVRRIVDLLDQLFSTYSYIGPLREEPSRRYIYEDEIIEIGKKGENAAYIYLSKKMEDIKQQYFYNYKDHKFYQEKQIKLRAAVEKWMNEMDIYNFEPEPNNEIIYLNLNSNASIETRVNIADVGFGVSQIFPIILAGLRIPKSHTLLLEQPEIHLHPKLQMKMADFFVSLALSEKNVIVETHSDHIINRIVRRIVEDNDHDLSKLIGIYFIKPTPNGSLIEEVKIDPMKGIVNWPDDFFDQTASEQELIIKAGLKKRLNKQ